jgi:hypothetical protein
MNGKTLLTSISLAFVSSIALFLVWLSIGVFPLLFVGFVPLFFVLESLSDWYSKWRVVFGGYICWSFCFRSWFGNVSKFDPEL